jgi:hypothetical protein
MSTQPEFLKVRPNAKGLRERQRGSWLDFPSSSVRRCAPQDSFEAALAIVDALERYGVAYAIGGVRPR